jgi:shikimate dehydrogenase
MRALYLLLGDPVAHSKSPAIHARAFQMLGVDAVYAPCRVTDVPAAMQGLRALGVAGANVTIPHKQAVIPFLDEVDPIASRIGAVNCIVQRDGMLRGFNTDREGFLRALGAEAPRPAVVVGAGGSARAVLDALPGASVLARNRERAARLGAPLVERDALREARLVVNCTPVGMTSDELPFDPAALRADATVVDLVYRGATGETALVRASRALRAVDGIAVLVHQAIASLELWLGRSELRDLYAPLREAALA